MTLFKINYYSVFFFNYLLWLYLKINLKAKNILNKFCSVQIKYQNFLSNKPAYIFCKDSVFLKCQKMLEIKENESSKLINFVYYSKTL